MHSQYHFKPSTEFISASSCISPYKITSKNVQNHIHNSGCRPLSQGFLTLVVAKSKVDGIITFNKCYVQGVLNLSINRFLIRCKFFLDTYLIFYYFSIINFSN